jgi:hypothetical protein
VEADTGYDAYSTASNMGRGIDQAYFARFDPATGEILKAQVLLCRQKPDGGGKPSQIQITGIHADTTGRTYLAGYCEAFIRQRDRQTVAGRPVGAYHKPEVFLLGVSPDFKSRSVWTVFSAERCEAAAWGLTCRDERAALVGEVYEGSAITTTNAPLTNAMAHVDGYLVYWKTR